VPPSANPPHHVGRGVPDVDPVTGVVVMQIDGKHLEPIGGTSAATPLWASLIVRLNEGLNARCGFINPVLYTEHRICARRAQRHHFRQQLCLRCRGWLGRLHRSGHAERRKVAECPLQRRRRDAEGGGARLTQFL